MRTTLAIALCALVTIGCNPPPGSLPNPVPPQEAGSPDFPIKARPGCSAEVVAASSASDLAAIASVAAHGGIFTCGPREDPLPLDEAVMSGDAPRIRALLDAHADPNARWSTHGDRFPLQEAIESRSAHRTEMVQRLLEQGADPNQRWCPFETRGEPRGCVSKSGVTPLLMAAGIDDAAATFLLLEAGADPRLEGDYGANALDIARGKAVLYLLIRALPPSIRGHRDDTLAYFNKRDPETTWPGPWSEHPLTRAIVGTLGYVTLPPLPPRGRRKDLGVMGPSERVDRVGVLLSLGADPNERLSAGGADWTPLGLAVAQRDVELVVELLRQGVDQNARWCVPIQLRANPVLQREPGCTAATGITAIMFAASLGEAEIVRWLSRQGADIALRDWRNRSALDYALQARHEDIARHLRTVARYRALAPQ